MVNLWPRATAARVAVFVAAFLAVIALFLALYDWNSLRAPIARMAGRYLHRRVQIGRLEVHLLRWRPSVTIDGLRIADPAWAGSGDTLDVGSITVAVELGHLFTGRLVLAKLLIDHPQVTLLRDQSNRATWDFSDDQAKPKPEKVASSPTQIPLVHVFTMNGGELKVDDQVRKLTFQGSVSANEGAGQKPFELHGHGDLNGKKFDLTFSGSSLSDLQLDKPYDFDTRIEAGPLRPAQKDQLISPSTSHAWARGST